jgi:hypothetical protein
VSCTVYEQKMEVAYSNWEQASATTEMAELALQTAIVDNGQAAAGILGCIVVAGVGTLADAATAGSATLYAVYAAIAACENVSLNSLEKSLIAIESAKKAIEKAKLAEAQTVDALYAAIDAWCDCVHYEADPHNAPPPPDPSEIEVIIDESAVQITEAESDLDEAESDNGETEDAIAETEDAIDDVEEAVAAAEAESLPDGVDSSSGDMFA